MAVKGKNIKNSNAYDGNAASFPTYALPRKPGNTPLSREELMLQRQKQKAAPNKKSRAANNKKNSKNTASGKKRKKVDPNKKYRLEKERRIRKGRDYFFVMRKLVCFIVFLLFAVCIGLFVVGYMNIMPEYTSLFVEPDYTPAEERLVTEDEETGELIEYVDKSVHYTTVDPIMGFLKKFVGLDLGDSPKYDSMAASLENGVSDIISSLSMTYYPIAMVLFIVVALICMVKAFLGMFGKRIFRLFGLGAFWMIIFALIVVVGGVASNMPLDQNLDFAQIVPFLISGLLRPADGPTTAAGFGLLAMVILPLIILILSMFMKKKIPYSIFD